MTRSFLSCSTSINDDQLKKIFENITENDLFICSLCSSLCTTTHSKHQLVSTQCGHLFGKNCIRKCFKENHQCPFCHKDLLTRREQQLRSMCLSSVVTIFPSELSRMREERQTLRRRYQSMKTKLERIQMKFNQNRQSLRRINQRILQCRKRNTR